MTKLANKVTDLFSKPKELDKQALKKFAIALIG